LLTKNQEISSNSDINKLISDINSNHTTFLNRKKKNNSDSSVLESSLHIDELDIESEMSESNESFKKAVLRKFYLLITITKVQNKKKKLDDFKF